ncbi:hypothetical protein STENM327S_06734 [Streptomyces tendae]
MTKTTGITWAAASARRFERQFLAKYARTGTPVADVAASMLGVHAQVLSAAELSVGLRADGVARADVRGALWPTVSPTAPPSPPPPPPSLVKAHGPRGTVHLLPARDLPMWCAALPAIPARTAASATGAHLTEEQAGQVVAAIADALDGAFLTVDELGEEVVARTGPWAGDLVMPAFQTMWPRWRQVMHRAGQCGALSFGPNRGRKVTYTRPPHFTPLPPEEASRLLVRRYLYAYGPATPQHFARWLAAPPGWAKAHYAARATARPRPAPARSTRGRRRPWRSHPRGSSPPTATAPRAPPHRRHAPRHAAARGRAGGGIRHRVQSCCLPTVGRGPVQHDYEAYGTAPSGPSKRTVSTIPLNNPRYSSRRPTAPVLTVNTAIRLQSGCGR